MISRTLVPVDVRPPTRDELKRPARRTTTYMDDRTVVPPDLADAPPLDGKSSIPSYLPLDVLVNRTLVPRGMPAKPIEKLQEAAEYHAMSVAILDSRVVVPAYVEPANGDELRSFEKAPQMTAQLRQVVEPDVFITGDPNLLIAPAAKHDAKYDAMVRTASLIVHIGLVIFIIFLPKIFPYHPPTQAEIDLARNQLNFIYQPPTETAKPALPPGPKIRISPKTLKRVAPTIAPPVANPPPVQTPPERPAPELPEAPVPRAPVNTAPTQPPAPEPSHLEPIKPPPTNPGRLNLNIPSNSPNKALENQLQDAINQRGGGSLYTAPGGNIPRGGGGGGGQGGPGMQPGVMMLTPTQGVDFDAYLRRLVESVRRNWYAVMPESARMGEKGIVYITFHVYRDGSVKGPDPVLERTSGREPLDAAAMSSIRTSSPFEPLPSQWKGDAIELRFAFFYNIPVSNSY